MFHEKSASNWREALDKSRHQTPMHCMAEEHVPNQCDAICKHLKWRKTRQFSNLSAENQRLAVPGESLCGANLQTYSLTSWHLCSEC